jgi:hypothetical protein
VDARLTFLEDRIATQRTHAEIWWSGWLTFYTFGAIFQGTRAMTAELPAEQADLWISAIKATGGSFRYLLQPYGGIQGLDEAGGAHLSASAKAARLHRAERILEHNADKTASGRAWYAHAINVGINLLGGVIVAIGFEDPAGGFLSAGIGTAVGEVSILTAPWEADDDLAEYRRRFGTGDVAESSPRVRGASPQWFIVPTSSGGSVGVVF